MLDDEALQALAERRVAVLGVLGVTLGGAEPVMIMTRTPTSISAARRH
jgi:hypothetical protein